MTAQPVARSKTVDIHTHMYPPEYIKLLESRTSIPLVRKVPGLDDPRLILLGAEVAVKVEGPYTGATWAGNIAWARAGLRWKSLPGSKHDALRKTTVDRKDSVLRKFGQV